MPRTYELKRRAERQEETRQRIVDATVALHREVGPARTTISAIAERAGVERLTVYRHFPDEAPLFAACGARFQELRPIPDPTPWTAIADPVARLRAALGELYAYYRAEEPMLANVARDAPLLPTLQALLDDAYTPYWARVREVLLAGWTPPPGPAAGLSTWTGASGSEAAGLATGRPHRVAPTSDASVQMQRTTSVAAALGLAVAFATWRTLTRQQGLDDARAVDLMTRLVACAAGGDHHDDASRFG